MPYCPNAETNCVWYGECPPDCSFLYPPEQFDPLAILNEVLAEQYPVAPTIEDTPSHFHPHRVSVAEDEDDYLLAQAIAREDEGGFFFPLHLLTEALNNFFSRFR